MAMRALAARVRSSAWLGWQIESNWADLLTFSVYSLLRPLGTSLILAGMYWAVASRSVRPEMFAAFYVANAFHEYVVRVLVGMGWVIAEDREDFQTLRYVYAAPIGLATYLCGRSIVKFALASFSVSLILIMGWWVLGIRWDPAAIRWLPLVSSFAIGLVATLFLGLVVAGAALLLPRAAVGLNEGLGVSLFLLCGVIFPVDLLPPGLQQLSIAMPFTMWYEALRRYLLGHGASAVLGAWSDARLIGSLALSTAVFGLLATWGFRALDRRARELGRLDHSTLF